MSLISGINSPRARYTGWIVTYIIREKHGRSSSGYISSGYYGGELNYSVLILPCFLELSNLKGIMIGRVALLKVNEKVRVYNQ